MVIKQLVAQVFNLPCKSSHDSAMAITKVRLAIFFALTSSISTVFQLKTLLAQRTSHASNSLSTQTEISNFLVNQVS